MYILEYIQRERVLEVKRDRGFKMTDTTQVSVLIVRVIRVNTSIRITAALRRGGGLPTNPKKPMLITTRAQNDTSCWSTVG